MNVRILDDAPQTLKLTSAILLYAGSAIQDGAIAVQHHARIEKGRATLGPGEFVTESFVSELLAVCQEARLTYVPANTVALGQNAVAWFEPAALRTMFFRANTDRAVSAFDGKLVPQPPLLFVARNRGLSVFALETNERPTMKTPLCLAPFWNVYDDHRVCLGSMRIPKSMRPEETDSWTAAFFASEFTHLSGGKRWAHAGTYAELLADAAAWGSFNPAWLKGCPLTLERALCGK